MHHPELRSNGLVPIKVLQDEAIRYTDDSQTGPNTGYFTGGLDGPVSTMDKVDYSSDTNTVIPGAALSLARYGAAGASVLHQDILLVVLMVQTNLQ